MANYKTVNPATGETVREFDTLDDAGVEARLPSRGDGGEPTRPRDGHRGERWVERDGRAVGDARAGDEEGGVERDRRDRRAPRHRAAAQAAVEQRPVPDHRDGAVVRHAREHEPPGREAPRVGAVAGLTVGIADFYRHHKHYD